MKRWISLGILLFWPTLLLAQNAGNYSLDLSPPPTDLSYIYLSNMFGYVDGLLFGTGSQLGGVLFSVYNSGILVLGGIIILYTFLIGTIKTAHEGEVLGREWSSVWIPLRTTAGIALLIPKTSGYSFIQIFMMWVVLQGIGTADSVWNAALKYLYSGGIIITQNYAGNTPVTLGPMIETSAQLLRSLTCVEMLQLQLNQYIAYQNQRGVSTLSSPPDFATDIINTIDNSKPSTFFNYVSFPQSNYYTTNGVCGTLQWNNVWTDLPTALRSNPQIVQQWQSDNTRAKALSQTIMYLIPVAKSIASNYVSKNAIPLGVFIPPNSWGAPDGKGPFLVQGDVLSNAASTYYAIMSTAMQAMAQSANNQKNISTWISEAESMGWAMAGAYYFNVVNANQQIANVTSGSTPAFSKEPDYDFTNDPKVTNYLGGKNSQYVLSLQMLINGSSNSNNNDYIVSLMSPFIMGAKSFGGTMTYGSTNVNADWSFYAGGNPQASALAQTMHGVLKGIGTYLSGLANAKTNNINPVVGVADFGAHIASSAFNSILTLVIIGFTLTFVLGLVPFNSIGNAGISVVTAITGFFAPLYVVILSFGLVMAYYIPMIPFIIFIFGVIGWFIAVAEAMLAAPLVALGISHPEGAHPILGKADPAIAMLVNIFIRPTFMILGLLFGMMLSYVGLWLINQGFVQAYFMALASAGSVGAAFSSIGGLIVYVFIIIQVVQKSFSLIHLLPDQVMRWLGMNIEGMGGEAQAEGMIGARARSSLGKIAGFTGSTVKLAESLGHGTAKLARSFKGKSPGGAMKS